MTHGTGGCTGLSKDALRFLDYVGIILAYCLKSIAWIISFIVSSYHGLPRVAVSDLRYQEYLIYSRIETVTELLQFDLVPLTVELLYSLNKLDLEN